jgi:AraC-like DNA-binding protein
VATSSITVLKAIVGLLAERGVDSRPLLAELSVEPAALDEVDGRIPLDTIIRAWELGAVASRDDAFGLHFGESVPVGAFPVLDYALRACPTLGDGLARLVQYQRIVLEPTHVRLHADDDGTWLSHAVAAIPSPGLRHLGEAALAVYLERARSYTGSRLVPRVVRLSHPAPRVVAEHRRVFGTDVEFDAASNELLFTADQTRLPITSADPGLRAVLDRQAMSLIAQLPQGEGLAYDIAEVIADGLPGDSPSMTTVARKLGMSARSLRRKLDAQGTSFDAIVTSVRRELAERYLKNPSLSIGEVSFLLGFSEPSAFHRAFRRWTGETPQQYRGSRAG